MGLVRRNVSSASSASQYSQRSYVGQAVEVLPVGDMALFMEQIERIRNQISQVQDAIPIVDSLHRRQLRADTDNERDELAAEIARQKQTLSQVVQNVPIQLAALKTQNQRSTDGLMSVRKPHLDNLKERFSQTLRDVAEMEMRNRRAIKSHVQRQLLIVKPDATTEEIELALQDQERGGQIFAQAVVSSRQSSARLAFNEAKSRNVDILEIEKTIVELSHMMQDMATIVLNGDEQLEEIEQKAEKADEDIKAGTKKVSLAKRLAKSARKRKWWFFILGAVLFIVVAGIIVLHFVL